MSTDEDETTMEMTSSTVLPNSTPKLSLFSLPKKQVEPAPGMLTPPLQAAAAVPFHWEEAPGRPKPPGHGSDPKPASARCLDLPPRMLTSFDSAAKLAGMPSPTTVIDRPEVGDGGRSLSSTWSSFRAEGRSKRFEVKENVGFGSSRWGILKGRSKGGGRVCEEEEESLGDILSAVLGGDGGCDGGGGGETKVKITRVKRRGSFFSPSHSKSKSHLWVSIYESIKQVVPWRRRQRNADEKSNQSTAVRSTDLTV